LTGTAIGFCARASGRRTARSFFDQLDLNRDQAIDAVELRESFEILDRDGDGAIEPQE
jgi:hypothetical protein